MKTGLKCPLRLADRLLAGVVYIIKGTMIIGGLSRIIQDNKFDLYKKRSLEEFDSLHFFLLS